MEQRFRYTSKIHEIPRIRKDLETLEHSWNIPKTKMKQIRVIVEELFSNIVRFAYEDQEEHFIDLVMDRKENIIEIEIIDDGMKFNPLEGSEDPLKDPALPEAGGMGITLVQTFANNMSYRRLNERNHLKIEKRI